MTTVWRFAISFRELLPLYDIPIHDEGTGFSIVGADAVAHTAINTPFDLPVCHRDARS